MRSATEGPCLAGFCCDAGFFLKSTKTQSHPHRSARERWLGLVLFVPKTFLHGRVHLKQKGEKVNSGPNDDWPRRLAANGMEPTVESPTLRASSIHDNPNPTKTASRMMSADFISAPLCDYHARSVDLVTTCCNQVSLIDNAWKEVEHQ